MFVEIVPGATHQKNKKSRHNSRAPWEFPPPDTSRHRTPRRWQLSPFCQRRPNRDITCSKKTAWFGMVSAIVREFNIPLQCDFCYKNMTARREGRDSAFMQVSIFFAKEMLLSHFTSLAHPNLVLAPLQIVLGVPVHPVQRWVFLSDHLASQRYKPPVSLGSLPCSLTSASTHFSPPYSSPPLMY